MTRTKIESLKAENLEARVAPTVFDQPGNSDGHRNKEWSKSPLVVIEEPVTSPEPSAPMPSDPLEPIL